MQPEGFTIHHEVYVPDRLRPHSGFENNYIELRRREQRLYNDEELLQLPLVRAGHVHRAEWQLRKRSCNRLLYYLEKKEKPLRILEVGCGNGWLSHRLAALPGSKLIGLDINFTELQQAARVFSHIPNLLFMYGDIEAGLLDDLSFDIILFASCIQYFPSAPGIVASSLRLVKPGGEIHILDSPFYKPAARAGARKRTAAYFRKMGFPAMADHYYHHSLGELELFGYKFLYRPSVMKQYFLKNENPFPWICIRRRPGMI